MGRDPFSVMSYYSTLLIRHLLSTNQPSLKLIEKRALSLSFLKIPLVFITSNTYVISIPSVQTSHCTLLSLSTRSPRMTPKPHCMEHRLSSLLFPFKKNQLSLLIFHHHQKTTIIMCIHPYLTFLLVCC